jgi:hypothetical protein
VQALQARHAIMSQKLPVPASHGWSRDHGLVLMDALPGKTLRASLQDKRAALPDPAGLATLLNRIPNVGDGRRPFSPAEAARGQAELLRHLLPDLGTRLDALLDAFSGTSDTRPATGVHGDFHDAQLLLRHGALAGLLDVDTVGEGQRADDWGTMIAHLAVTGMAGPAATRERIRAYGRRVLAVAEEDSDAAHVRLSAAAVIVGLATGPFRVQQPSWPEHTRRRIDLAEAWVESAAQTAPKRSLTHASEVSHVAAR